MSLLFPFRALRPIPSVVSRVASVPYDVVDTAEARALAADNPLSFLHVTRAEIDLPPDTHPYGDVVYEKAVENLAALRSQAPLVQDDEPALYVYRLRMGSHTQTGVAGCFSVDEYDRGLVKQHERTRRDKEDDRTRHIVQLRAQTGLVFLTHRKSDAVAAATRVVTAGQPLYDFTAEDNVQHVVWRATGAERDALVAAFGGLDVLYIADGHHRAASASRASRQLAGRGAPGGDAPGGDAPGADASRFVAVAFPDDEMQILPYNRVVADLNGHDEASLLERLRAVGSLQPGSAVPERTGEVAVFVGGTWYTLRLPAPDPGAPRDQQLDVEILQQRVLAPIFGIGDPRSDKRIDFVGGMRGTKELERLVGSGRFAAAFSMYPVGIDDLMRIADDEGIMPPKSTWFEPKLRDGILVHLI